MDSSDPALYRIIEVYRDGKWVKTKIADIKRGELFRYKEPTFIATWEYHHAVDDGFQRDEVVGEIVAVPDGHIEVSFSLEF
jgi:hypothetical protein